MAHLIIGHTTETTARIWVRGDKACSCQTVVHPLGRPRFAKALGEETDFTGVVHVKGLTPGTIYSVEASFSSEPEQKVSGGFQTFPEQPAGRPSSFSFVLSSCNLSVVSINNFLARLLATAGAMTALTSLDLPLQRWRAPRFIWLRWLLRWPLRVVIGLDRQRDPGHHGDKATRSSIHPKSLSQALRDLRFVGHRARQRHVPSGCWRLRLCSRRGERRARVLPVE